DDRRCRNVLGQLARREGALEIRRRCLEVRLGAMRDRERVIDREQRAQVADVLRPLKGGSQVAERGLWLAEVDGDRAKCLQHPDSEQPVAVVRALERAEQGEQQLARASRVATSTRRGRELVIDRVRKTVIVKLCREALRDREIAMSLALPLDEI